LLPDACVFEELEKGQALRDVVLEVLRQGPGSISQLAKRLKEPYNLDLHRLALAGYLKAMADVGLLEEREIPPAKVYALKPTHAPPTLYDAIARRVRDLGLPEPEATKLIVQVLFDLFHRPIFREELRRAGFEGAAGLRDASAEDRQTARRLFAKSPLRLPFNDPAYLPSNIATDEGQRLRDAARGVLASIVLHEFHAAGLAQGTKQATLGA